MERVFASSHGELLLLVLKPCASRNAVNNGLSESVQLRSLVILEIFALKSYITSPHRHMPSPCVESYVEHEVVTHARNPPLLVASSAKQSC